MDSTEIVQEEVMDKFIDASLTKLGYFTQSKYKQIWYEEQQAIEVLLRATKGKAKEAQLCSDRYKAMVKEVSILMKQFQHEFLTTSPGTVVGLKYDDKHERFKALKRYLDKDTGEVKEAFLDVDWE